MSDLPSVSIIVTAARASRSLPAVLDTIKAQDYDGPLETIVAVADGETAAVVAPTVAAVVGNPQGTTPAGLNRALQESRGEVIVRVDAHSLIPPDYVTRVVDLLESTSAEVVGGMQVPQGDAFWQRAIAAAMSSRLGAGDARYRIGGEAGPTDTVYLGAFRKETMETHGGFNERFLRNQDYELNHRIRSAGGIVWFDPTLRVEYRPRASLTDLASQYFQYGRWKRFFSRVYPGTLRLRQLAAPVVVVGLTLALIASLIWEWALLIPTAYVVALLGAGIGAARDAGRAAVGVPVALAVMHIAWGLGFLLPQRRDR